ncbi:Histone deacetylase superfamily protein [alpha proteobacterium BAL199]|jgi:acetoin utilization deacetylase AcuC-like enzyme/GNAT superfamily N-acetyltransferase|nr:Histone deacetylase superfamily protein [alpha proteobacterium BAL199]
MLKFVRVMAGADPSFEAHLNGVTSVFLKAFPFNEPYIEKITRYATGENPPRCEAVLLAATRANKILGFSVSFYFADLKAAYLDYIASDPARSARGIGGAIYEMTRDDQRKRGARRFFLDSLPDEPGPLVHDELLPESRRRLAFYERFGARPVIGTAYERTATPSNLGDGNMLLCDAMGSEKPMSRKFLRSVVERIMLAKNGLDAADPLVAGLLKSIVDDPVRVRAPRYMTPPKKLPTLNRPIDIVVTSGESPTIEHSPFKGYYERPSRVAAVRRALEGLPVSEHKPESWGREHILAVHDRRMVKFLEETSERLPDKRIVYPEIFPIRFPDRLPRNFEMRAGYFCIDTSTPLTNAVYPAARRAVDAVLTGAKLVRTATAPWCYVVVRPPGHHAERRAFGGFCYFNNAAVAAHYLSASGKKVAILDIDHHHGNGMQDIFYERSDVLTVSIHGHPEETYPFFAGFDDERGRGPGEGFNRNYPIRPGVDDAGYLTVLARALRRIEVFKPDYLIVSLGVDIMKGDPTGHFFVTGDGMRRIGDAIGRSRCRTLIVQEGGYNLANLRRGVREFLLGFAVGHETASAL